MNLFSLFFIFLLVATVGHAQTPANSPAATAPGGGQTVITSDSLDLNLSKTKGQKQGLFRGSVKVDEPRFTMTSKEMTVFFAEDDSVQDVEAREDVVIKRKDGTSETWSEKAIYNMKEKKLTLLKVTKQPKAVAQDKTVFADKIILFPEE
ncbi:MAG: LptA/OstA family protein, partial [Verrucomicrobiota bacterium]